MAQMPPPPRPKSIPWWAYLLWIVGGLTLLLIIGAAGLIIFWLSPTKVKTPRIAGTVTDVITGKPVAGMDVCLLGTYTGSSGISPRVMKIWEGATTQTDSSGKFSFAPAARQLDSFEKPDAYGITVTDPLARWNGTCGQEIYLLGAGMLSGGPDIFQTEAYILRESKSAESSKPLYFPVALVGDPRFARPLAYGVRVSFKPFPVGTLVRKIDDPGNLKIPVVPLLPDENECSSATDAAAADLCRAMNGSDTADALRKSSKTSLAAQ